MKKLVVFASVTALGIGLTACGDDAKPSGQPPASTTAGGKPTTTAAAVQSSAPAITVAVRDEDIPAEVDFEAEAEKEITVDNMDAELAAMEKELGP